jgi:ATP-dependent DNA ligase
MEESRAALGDPMRLLCIPEASDHWNIAFEPKIDGFRALAYVERYDCRPISRNGHEFKSWTQFSHKIAPARARPQRAHERRQQARSYLIRSSACCDSLTARSCP